MESLEKCRSRDLGINYLQLLLICFEFMISLLQNINNTIGNICIVIIIILLAGLRGQHCAKVYGICSLACTKDSVTNKQ